MRYYCLLALIASALPASGGMAADRDLPPELMYKGKPVEAFCIDQLINNADDQKVVRLDKCNLDEIIKGESMQLNSGGKSYGYSYRFKEDQDVQNTSETPSPYDAYQYLGKMNGQPVVLLHWSGGGSGEFSDLVRLARNGDTLEIIDRFAGGDRCNGSINGGSVDAAGTLTFETMLTPWDIVALGDRHAQRDYKDLDGGAASCAGTASLRVMPQNHVPELMSIEAMVQEEMVSDSNPYNACYAHTLQEFAPKKDNVNEEQTVTLTPAMVTQLASAYHNCADKIPVAQ